MKLPERESGASVFLIFFHFFFAPANRPPARAIYFVEMAQMATTVNR